MIDSVRLLSAGIHSNNYIMRLIRYCLVVVASFVLSLSIASAYLMQRLGEKPPASDEAAVGSLVHSSDRVLPSLRIERIREFPWTDMSENVLHAFYISHGYKFEKDAVVNHMPGVYAYLAGFMWLAGLGESIPGHDTAMAAFTVSAIAVVFFQMACLIAAFWIVRLTALGLLFAPWIVAYTAFRFDMAMPMSETMLPYWLALLTVCFYRGLMADDREESVKWLSFVVFPGTIVSLFIGLTVFLSNLVIAGSTAVALGLALRALSMRKRVQSLFPAVSIAIVLLIGVFSVTDLKGLIFWNIVVNSGHHFPIVSNLLKQLFVDAEWFLGVGQDPLWANQIIFLALAGISWLVMLDRDGEPVRRRSAAIWFLSTIIFASLLTQWRTVEGYKSWMPFGFSLGLTVILLSYLIHLDRKHNRWIIVVAMLLIVGFWVPLLDKNSRILDWIGRQSNKHSPRHVAFEEANVCRFGERENCRCLQVTLFGPQWFLFEDAMPCENRYPTFANILAANSRTREWVVSDAKRNDMAFLVMDEERMVAQGIPSEAILYWSQKASCRKISDNMKVCYGGQ